MPTVVGVPKKSASHLLSSSYIGSSWNGLFASLLFINRWEYTRNTTWAKTTAYPLLNGLNAWWSCFLKKEIVGTSGAYVYHDTSSVDPDNEHENQKVPDPQIALALLRRSLSAQLSMATAIGLQPPPFVADILAHLVPYNTGTHVPRPPPPPPPPPVPTNCTINGRFAVKPETRCTGDHGMGKATSIECCQAWCYADATCDSFSYCISAECKAGPPPFVGNCWKYGPLAKCTAGAGFTSGQREKQVPNVRNTVWTSYGGALTLQSDTFACSLPFMAVRDGSARQLLG